MNDDLSIAIGGNINKKCIMSVRTRMHNRLESYCIYGIQFRIFSNTIQTLGRQVFRNTKTPSFSQIRRTVFMYLFSWKISRSALQFPNLKLSSEQHLP